MSIRRDDIVLGWALFSHYAANLIMASPREFTVIAVRPEVPYEGLDEKLCDRLRWVAPKNDGGWAELGLRVPRLFFQPSWGLPAFNRLGAEVRAAGGNVVVMFDNAWRGDLRQILGALLFRTFWRRRFSAAWVVGASGARLARMFGFPNERIYRHHYGSDFGSLVQRGMALTNLRRKRVIFVGRLIDIKGVHELMGAWRRFSEIHSEWELHVYGTGPLEPLVRGSHVAFHGFQQPEVIAAAMAEARFLILPSHDEHWGVVVCEAAQSGCGLLLSRAVGSHHDLVGQGNGYVFREKSEASILAALKWAAARSDSDLQGIMSESLRMGNAYSTMEWSRVLDTIIRDMQCT